MILRALLGALALAAASCAGCDDIPCTIDSDCGAGGACDITTNVCHAIGAEGEGEGAAGEGEGAAGEGEGAAGEGEGEGAAGEGEGAAGEGEGEGAAGEGEGEGAGEGEGEGAAGEGEGEGSAPNITSFGFDFPDRPDTAKVTLGFNDPDNDVIKVTVDWGDGTQATTTPLLTTDTTASVVHVYTSTIVGGSAVTTLDDIAGHSAIKNASFNATAFPGVGDVISANMDGNVAPLSASSSPTFIPGGALPHSLKSVQLSSEATILFSNPGTVSSVDYTFSLWVDPIISASFNGNTTRIAGVGDSIAFSMESGHLHFGQITSGSPHPGSVSIDGGTGAFTLDTFTHLAGVVSNNGTELSLYVNGSLVQALDTAVPANDSTCRFYVGDVGSSNSCSGTSLSDPSSENGLQADVDDVDVYSRALTADEIKLLHLGAAP